MGKKHSNYYKTEDFLRGYRATKAHISILERRKEDIKEYKSRGIKAINTDGIRMHSVSVDRVGNEVVKINEMEEIVNENLKNEKRVIRDIDNAIGLLDELEIDIIKMKYFDNMQMSLIADYLGYDRTVISRKKDLAVRTISKALWGNASIQKELKKVK